MASIEWAKLPSQPKFDDVVEAFFVNEYSHESGDTYAVNGRGGDDGIDIHLRHDSKTIIVQLKFFPEGFSGGFKETRQDQIRNSFKSALVHDPDEWWLVVPTTLTNEERKYVLQLPNRQTPPLTRPTVRVFGGPELDILASKHPDLVTYYTRDELLDAAKVYNQETALLIDQRDVLARVAALSKQADTLDPNWGIDLFTYGDIVGTTVVAKHPLAAERSPITITMNAKFSADQEELRRKFDRVMGYGTHERLELPSTVISNYNVDGPAFIAHSSDDVELIWLPVESESAGQPFTVVFHDKDDRQVATFTGATTWTGSAAVGASVKVEFYSTVTLEFLIPYESTTGVKMSVSVDLAGSEPSDIVRALTMLERFDDAYTVKLALDGKQFAGLLLDSQSKSVLGDARDGMLTHKDIAADLVYVQDKKSLFFTYPETVDPADRVYLRCLRRLLERNCVVLPEQNQVKTTLNGKNNENTRKLLSGATLQLIIDQEDFGFEVFGHNFYLGHCRIYAPRIRAVGANGLFKQFEARDAAGRDVTLRTEDGWGFWVFVLGKVDEDPDGKLRPKSLGLTDYADAPDIARSITELS